MLKPMNTNTQNTKETLSFQTEVNQILHLMIHALYSNKEIFLRELISNAADACDKLRFEAIANDALYEGEKEFKIEIDFDQKNNILTITDNGVGMSREEVIGNIGTIARSGTKAFMQKLSGDQKADANLIGQFGVGFYSAFIVAKKVELITRRAGLSNDLGVKWTAELKTESVASNNECPDGFSIEQINVENRGTKIILYLKDEEKEFCENFRVRHLITQYSDHIPFSIKIRKHEYKDGKETIGDWETVNKANALWLRSKAEISEDEYQSFYKHIAHDYENALSWTHNKVEGKLEYTSLLYIPTHPPFDLWEAKPKHGIKIYVRRVFIRDDVEQILPRFLRFVRGVVDSNDLPLNVSREMLQGSKIIEQIKNASIKRVLTLIEDLAQNKPEDYQKFWDNFGKVLKEGVVEEPEQKEIIQKLLRFNSTHSSESENQQITSLDNYIERKKEGQDKIYYLTAENINAAKNSPHLEIFRKHGIEVLLLTDRIDEWLVRQLHEFKGLNWASIADSKLDISTLPGEDKKAIERIDAQSKDLVERIKKSLVDKVSDVKISHRLTNSPACIVLDDNHLAGYMKEWLKSVGQNAPDSKPILEINPEHPLLTRMNLEIDETRFGDWAKVLLDQAVLAEGGQLENPAEFVSKLNQLMFK